MNRPSFLNNIKKKICLICEGFEEYEYISKILEMNLCSDAYQFDLVNAESCSNIFVNLCTMHVMLMHFGDVNLQTHNKHKNFPEIQRLTGLESLYKGSQEQRGFIFSQITKNNYQKMKEAISEMSVNYKERPSTNFLYYLNCFESSDTSWIDEINNLIETE